MSINSALAAGREAAEKRMTDSCRIGIWSRSAQPDADTLEYTYLLSPIVYEGKCEFVAGATEVRDVDAAGQLLVEQLSTLRLPVAGTEGVTKDMRVEVLSSDTDPGLPGTQASVQAPFRGAHTTARRFAVEVLT